MVSQRCVPAATPPAQKKRSAFRETLEAAPFSGLKGPRHAETGIGVPELGIAPEGPSAACLLQFVRLVIVAVVPAILGPRQHVAMNLEQPPGVRLEILYRHSLLPVFALIASRVGIAAVIVRPSSIRSRIRLRLPGRTWLRANQQNLLKRRWKPERGCLRQGRTASAREGLRWARSGLRRRRRRGSQGRDRH
jgi:hypothetical protein